MATVQKQLLSLALRVDNQTKRGQKFQDATAQLTIINASNASPIVITASTDHGMQTGNQCYITAVGGNTAANNSGANPNWIITKVNATQFSLDGSTGNGLYTSGGYCYPGLIAAIDGARFPRQRLADIYNDARLALFQGLSLLNDEPEYLSKLVDTIVRTASVTMTLAGSTLTGPFPSDYIEGIEAYDASSNPIEILPAELIGEVLIGDNPHLLQSTTNRFIFEQNAQFVTYNTGTAWPATEVITVRYYGVSTFTLADVLGNSVTETFSRKFEPIIITLAEAIANGMSQVEAIGLAKSLISIKGG
jgi:hypothetical protein